MRESDLQEDDDATIDSITKLSPSNTTTNHRSSTQLAVSTEELDSDAEALEYAALLGFCGCCTTFGGMMAYAFQLWMTPGGGWGGWDGFLDCVFSVSVTIVLSCSCFRVAFPLGSLYYSSLRIRRLSLCLCAPILLVSAYAFKVGLVGGWEERLQLRGGESARGAKYEVERGTAQSLP